MREEKPTAERVISRPGVGDMIGGGVIAGIFGILPILFWLPNPEAERRGNQMTEPEKIGLTLVFLVISGIIALATLCYRKTYWVMAEKTGLYWRRGRKRGRIDWNEVTDYSLQSLRQRQAGQNCVIETTTGKIRFHSKDWTNSKALQEFVQKHALNALANGWKQIGEREREHFPLTFVYDSKDNRTNRVLVPVFSVMLVGFYFYIVGGKLLSLPQWIHQDEAPYTLAMMGLFALMLMGKGFGLFLIAGFNRENRRRWKHKITATESGIRFEDGRDRVSLDWEKILFVLPERKGISSLIRVQGINGEFDFTGTLENFAVLQRLLATHVPEAVKRGKEMSPDEENLLAWKWDETAPTRTYHYRTRMNRAMAWFATVFASLPLLMYPLARNGYTVRDNSSELPFLIVPCLIVTVYLWRRYFSAKVVTDSRGVTHFSPKGKKFIAWGDILDMKQTSGQEILVPTLTLSGNRKRVRFSTKCARFDTLKAEIETRSPLLSLRVTEKQN